MAIVVLLISLVVLYVYLSRSSEKKKKMQTKSEQMTEDDERRKGNLQELQRVREVRRRERNMKMSDQSTIKNAERPGADTNTLHKWPPEKNNISRRGLAEQDTHSKDDTNEDDILPQRPIETNPGIRPPEKTNISRQGLAADTNEDDNLPQRPIETNPGIRPLEEPDGKQDDIEEYLASLDNDENNTPS